MSEEKKIRLYLDTSVPSAYYDTSKPMRQLITQKWFEIESLSYNLYISVITIEEIGKIKNDVKKWNISELTVIPIRFQKSVFSVKPLFKRFQQFKRFEKSLYGLKDRFLKANRYKIQYENS